MIAIELTGGLGNQLFEYAFIYSQHKKLNTKFFILKRGGPIELYRYFKLEKNLFYFIDRLFFDYKGFRLFFSHYLRQKFYNIISNQTLNQNLTVNNEESPPAVLEKITDGTVYRGYFQSELYFRDNLGDLSSIFSIRKKYVKEYDKCFNWLNKKKTVVIHIRLTDYRNAFGYLNLGGGDLSLPLSYYHSIIRNLDSDENFCIFISDDISTVKNEFSYLKNKYFSEENEIVDFQLMMNADICVISNSTFSWWAAYLNRKNNRTVYCPKHFLGFLKGEDYPTCIYPENWIQIPVA